VKKHGLTPRARILGLARPRCRRASWASAQVPATRKLMERLGFKISDFDLIELNEAFASQGIACLRQLGVKDDADFVNPQWRRTRARSSLGMSGARLAMTAVHAWRSAGEKRALGDDVRRVSARRGDGDREAELRWLPKPSLRAKRSNTKSARKWIASSRSLSSGLPSRTVGCSQ